MIVLIKMLYLKKILYKVYFLSLMKITNKINQIITKYSNFIINKMNKIILIKINNIKVII